MNPKQQLEVIKRGAAEVISEEDMLAKFEKSARTGKPLNIKLGLDPTAPDIHIGHTVVLNKLRQFQDMGHQAIIVIGDFTGRIGDPTGKSEARKQLSDEQVKANAKTYCDQMFKILDVEKTKVVFNSEWLSKMTFEDVIKLSAKCTVARILDRDDFQKRYTEGRPIGVHEFFYPLMQAYDSVNLEADVELGGTDQKFNNLMGRNIQREFGQEPQCVVLMPILPGTDGVAKMSKSLGNYIGIDEAPKEMFGKTMSVPDELMVQYFDCATNLPLEEKKAIEEGLRDGSLHPMVAKRRLGRQLVAQYHGEAAATEAEEEFDKVFKRKEVPDDIEEVTLDRSLLTDGRIQAAKLVASTGLAKSSGEARRLNEQGGVRINDDKVESFSQEIEPESGMVIKVGKRKFVRLIVS